MLPRQLEAPTIILDSIIDPLAANVSDPQQELLNACGTTGSMFQLAAV